MSPRYGTAWHKRIRHTERSVTVCSISMTLIRRRLLDYVVVFGSIDSIAEQIKTRHFQRP